MLSMLLLLLSGATVQKVDARSAPPASHMRKARDPDIAVQQELCAARRARTIAAYDLFIARHPGHALIATARVERQALVGRDQAQ